MRNRRSKEGDRLFKRVDFKLFLPGNKQFQTRRMVAPSGRGITAAAIEKELEHFAQQFEDKFPAHEYRLVQVGPTQFNFVWAGERQQEATA